jgi:phosphatidate phosphatase APP1
LFIAPCASLSREGPARGEEIVFFPSLASVSHDGQWLATVQGRVFEPAENSPGREALIDAFAVLVKADRADPLFRARARYLFSDSSRDARVKVRIGDQVVRLPASDPAGYFSGDIALSNTEAMHLANGGTISFQSLPTATNPQRFPGSAMLVPEEGVTVITDMDDTIKITDIRDHEKKVANTFVLPFRAVPGMAELYRSWMEALGPRIHFHVVSAGPWQFNEPLRQFMEQEHFPAFTWNMRSVDIGDASVLLGEATSRPKDRYEFKLGKIRAFMTRFPRRHVVLVGDSGEQDPEVYVQILSEQPDRVDAVFIRNVTREDRSADRYKVLSREHLLDERASKLCVFLDPKELPVLTPQGPTWSGPNAPTICKL